MRQANSGPDSNGCQFFVTCAKTDWCADWLCAMVEAQHSIQVALAFAQ